MGLVSVVMCTYNGERFVEEQLQSILSQTLQPAEVIVSDDHSEDATLAKVSALAKMSTVPIRITRNETRLGYADNFLTAAACAKGQYIAFSDQDDRWSPRKLERGMEALTAHRALLCTHAVAFMDESGARTRATTSRRFRRTRVVDPLRSSPWGNYFGFTMLLNRSLIDDYPADARGLDTHTRGSSMPHDRWIYFLATTFGRTVVLEDVLADYRQHSGQLYGGEQRIGIRERVAVKLATGQDQARYLADVAAYRARLLESLAVGPRRALGHAAANRWRAIAGYLSTSARLHDHGGAREHLGLLLDNVQHGAYGRLSHGGLGLERLLEDCGVTVMRSAPIRRAAQR